jgi:hypothetical protein
VGTSWFVNTSVVRYVLLLRLWDEIDVLVEEIDGERLLTSELLLLLLLLLLLMLLLHDGHGLT